MSEHRPDSGLHPSRPNERLWLALLLGLTVIVRTLTALFGPDHFNDDRDAYLAIAQGIAAGRGFSVPGSDEPTAYRPPLYPLLIAPVSGTGGTGQVGRGILHVALAVATAWLVWRAGAHLNLSVAQRFIAGLLLAVDPLLVLYANFPMTETLCTMLGAWLLERAVGSPSARSPQAPGTGNGAKGSTGESNASGRSRPWAHASKRWRSALLTGFVFGLCVLSRPTFLATGVLLAVVALIQSIVDFRASGRFDGGRLRRWGIVAAAAICTVAPWLIRNGTVMGHLIVTTTHGGYTLLLGNNATFYREVVSDSWSTVWEGESQQEWAEELNRRMDRLGLEGEVERDRWLSRRAIESISEHPVLFLKASVTRAIQFWNLYPGGESARRFPRWLLMLVAVFYACVWACGVVGVVRIVRDPRLRWARVLVIPLSFWLVHMVYWSNIRMRAPVMPAVVLVAAHGLCRLKQRPTS